MMSDRFMGLYRRGSLRKKGWDYSAPAHYFVTFCTAGREAVFGKIERGVLIPNKAGQIAVKIWNLLEAQFDFIQVDSFVAMPDHIHGIIRITSSSEETSTASGRGGITGQANPMLHKNLGRVIRWYKGRTTHDLRSIYSDFAWQRGYYDRIITDDIALYKVRRYIDNNPKNAHHDG
jgi:REP element-mobilizing transposase RayT